MKTAIIIHGMPSKEEYYNQDSPSQSNRHWLPWIQKQLILNDILAQTPEMPEPYEPNYEKWKAVFEEFKINEETILIGHSCGAGFLIRWLSENKVNVGKVILVAPWIDPGKELNTGFFNFTIDIHLSDRTKGLTVMYSIDDDSVIIETVEIIKEKIPKANFQEFTNKGHFCFEDLGTVEFPELLTAALQ